MDLGAFSVSLAVKDIKISQSFYEKFGFKLEREIKLLGGFKWKK